MTTPNPTPTTREREAARITKIALKYFRDNWQLRWALEQDITAALARERREALTEAIDATKSKRISEPESLIGDPWQRGYINAVKDIAAAIERLRDGEK